MKEIVFTGQEILSVSKQDKEDNLKTSEIIKIFENSTDLEKIKEAVRKAEERMVVTWASVEMKDNAGELIPMADLIKQQKILLERNGPITDTHTNKVHGQTLAFKVMENQHSKSLGVLHLDKMFAHDVRDDKLWGEIKSGERAGSSVGGFNTSVSFGRDKVTGESVKVLEGFHHRETASVRNPCNPLSLNEAFSVVAKSYTSKGQDVEKPKMVDDCVDALMEDPDFKPEPGRTKEEAAHAVCNARFAEKNKGEHKEENTENDSFAGFDTLGDCVAANVGVEADPVGYCMSMRNKAVHKTENRETDINKLNLQENIKKTEGDPMDSNELKKSLSEMKEILKSNSAEIAKLKKTVEERREEEEEKREDAPKPPKEEEEGKVRDKKKVIQAGEEILPTEEEEEKKKEEAASDIAGEEPARDQPESSIEEQSNQENTFKEMKKELADIKKMVALKAITPHPAAVASDVNKADVAKATDLRNLGLDLATGKKTMTWNDVHKAEEDYFKLSGRRI